MIIRVTVHVDTMGDNDCENIFFHSCKIYTDYEEALRDSDLVLNNYNLNDGCSLGSEEDFLALNAMLAERFNDYYNANCYATWEDLTQTVITKIAEDFCYHDWSDFLLEQMIEDMGIDLEEIEAA